MTTSRRVRFFLAVLALCPALAFADDTFTPLNVPARSVPVPGTVSSEMQQLIGAPANPRWKEVPTTSEEWKARRDQLAANVLKILPDLRQHFGVTMTKQAIAGVNCYVLIPATIPEANRNRVLIHLHGGYYVLAPGEAGTYEATLMAGFGRIKVISVDYRMPPDFPYPSGLDDAVSVWKESVKANNPANMAIFGTSAGGGMTLATVLRAKQEGLPLPAAIATGTPASDMTESGDSYFTNRLIDNVLVSYGPFGEAAYKLYANGHDLKDPMLSPIYGDFHGFPPAILTTGTRDLLLSDTVRVHRKLRQAGVEAQLEVFEGQSHAHYLRNPAAPEAKEAFGEITAFFDSHLGK